MTTQSRFHEALALQDACNPSGVAVTLVELIADARKDGVLASSDPAVRLTVSKLADLCGFFLLDIENYTECQSRATALDLKGTVRS